jgi:hypothetical protein
MRIGANSTAVFLGDGSPRVLRGASAQDAELETGALRGFVSRLAARNR